MTYLFSEERDPAPIFFNSNVQQLLKKLTRVDLNKVFRPKRYGVPLRAPEYKFLTTEELDEVINVLNYYALYVCWGRNSAVGIAAGYGLDDRVVRAQFPVGSRIFSSPRPDRFWGPLSLLSKGYLGLFSGGKVAGE
jgi:hypothetical protein